MALWRDRVGGWAAWIGAMAAAGMLQAAEVKDSLDVVTDTNRSAARSQEKIDKVSVETRALLEEYRKLRDGTEYQAAFTRELEELDQALRKLERPRIIYPDQDEDELGTLFIPNTLGLIKGSPNSETDIGFF